MRVGVAYYLFLDTPMVRDGERWRRSRDAGRPADPISRTYPLEPAIDATVRGIERRARRIAHPRFLHGVLAARGLLDSALGDRLRRAAIASMETAFAEEAQRIGPDAAARPPRR